MDLLEVLRKRRSVRVYSQEIVSEEIIVTILQAGLLAASGNSIKPWEFIVIKNKDMLKSMARCRKAGAQMLAYADCAIVVLGDEEKTDIWIEDCCVAMTNMHLIADYLGVGSCWIQGRLRNTSIGITTEEYLRGLLKFPENYRLEAILSLGMPLTHLDAYELETLHMEKVHFEIFDGRN